MHKNSFDIAALVLRLAGGGLMLTHGIPKLMKVLGGDLSFGDPIGIGAAPSLLLTVFAEVICAFLVLIGFKTKWASVPLLITMLVAALIVHGADPLGKKELALLYFAIYLVLFAIGGGKFSVDRLVKR